MVRDVFLGGLHRHAAADVPGDGPQAARRLGQPGSLRDDLQNELGAFPLFSFWGPATSIKATRWIADAAISVDKRFDPTLSLVYLPHLDYELQRVGPDLSRVGKDLAEVDRVCGQLIDYFEARGARVVILSEYGISPVSRPIHLNRALRERNLLTVRSEMGRELLDAGASRAFAVADHQVAHVYVNDPTCLGEVRSLLEATPGVERVLDDEGKRQSHIDHPRAGELVAIAAADSWFTYYYWLDDARMPDFARTVDIHRKPGYDPAELFLDPSLPAAKGRIAWTLLKKKLGFRYLMQVIPTDATLVKGSHGRAPQLAADGPLFMTRHRRLVASPALAPTDIYAVLLRHLTET